MLPNVIPVKFNILEIFQPLQLKDKMQSSKMFYFCHQINLLAFINNFISTNNNTR